MISSGKPDLCWAVESGDWHTHKEQSDAAKCLLRRLAGDDIVLGHDSQGAPYITGQPTKYISISHCRTAVAVAISDNHRVGIDIESRRKVSPSLMERVCTEEELAEINSSEDPTMTFLRFWTRKEAVLKMRGTGIRGFGSMVAVSNATDCSLEEIDCGIPDTVVALATAL